MESNIKFKKIFLISLIISLSISALLGIIIFLFGNFDIIEIKILLTTLTIGVFSLTGLCSAALFDQKRFSAFAIFGIIVSVWGFFYITSIIWGIIKWSSFNNLMKNILILIIVSISIAHASLLLLIKSDKRIVNISLVVTLLFVFLVAFELITFVYDFRYADKIWYRRLGVFAILDVLGTIITPILFKVTSLYD